MENDKYRLFYCCFLVTESDRKYNNAMWCVTRRRPNVDVMLYHRLRRCPDITATLGRRLTFAV